MWRGEGEEPSLLQTLASKTASCTCTSSAAWSCWSPLTKPEVWQPARPQEMLPGYLTHQEVAIHTAAREALHSLVLTCPLLRNAVLNAVASHAAGLPDDNPMAVRDTLAVLRSLAKGWTSCLRARAAGESQER
ncbi:hypothetical protein QJQ45_016467, partial [Haematococcus lacustris]